MTPDVNPKSFVKSIIYNKKKQEFLNYRSTVISVLVLSL